MSIVGLVQINSGALHFLPYSVGVLQAYTQQYAQRRTYQFLLPIFQIQAIDSVLEAFSAAQIIGFSAYIWNLQRSLALAQALKIENPERLIIFGGPQVPDRAEHFLRAHPYIDVCTHGEGERAFLALLESEPERQWTDIAGISFLDSQGKFQHQPREPRQKDLNIYPSPYLSGVFEPLMAAHPEKPWDAMWETNRGCPFSCSFCDWGSATQSKIYTFDMARLKAELAWFSQHKIHQVFCCDANFGILKRDLEIAQSAAQIHTETGYPLYLAVQNSKNVTQRSYAVHKILAKAGLDSSVTLSLQSTSPAVLKAVKRENISLDHYQELHRLLKADRIFTYTDVIIGLPGESYASFVAGLGEMMAGGQHNALKFYNASVLPNAEMGQPEYQAHYQVETVDSRCVYLHTPVQPPLDGIYETQKLVIATASMPREDWVRARTLAWWTDLLFYEHRLLKTAFLILHQQGIPYADLLTTFCQELPASHYPVIQRIQQFLNRKAKAIQNGDYEYCSSNHPIHNGIWWSAEAFILRSLIAEALVPAFYLEAFQQLRSCFEIPYQLEPTLILDLVQASRVQLQLAYKLEPEPITVQYNIWEVYQGILDDKPIALTPQQTTYHKPWKGPPFTVVPHNDSQLPLKNSGASA